MPEQINIASLSIDLNDVVKESVKLKKRIDDLKASQSELKKSGQQSSAAFVENEIQLKKLGKAYRDNQSFATALDQANEDLNKTMSIQGKSTQELRDSRSQLNQISKNIKGNTQEEVDLREKLNKAIDQQTEKLREQSSDFNKNKDRVGEYKDSILEAVAELREKQETLQKTKLALEANQEQLEEGTEAYEEMSQALVVVNAELVKVNDELGEGETSFKDVDLSVKGLIGSLNESGGASEYFSGGLGKAKKALISLTKSTLAFLATPLGIILAVVAGAFLLIKNAMNRSETATNKIKKAVSGFTGIVRGLLKFLEPLGEFLIDGLVAGFELVEKGIFKAMKGIAAGLEFLGFDDAAASLRSFTEDIEESVKSSKALALAEIELEKAQRLAQKTQLDYQKKAEKLRQLRDNEKKSIAERIKANEDLGVVLQKQLAAELAIANKALEVAKLRIQAEGETKETLDAQAEALTNIADIQERITGQESEQLSNLNSLRRDAAAKRAEIADKAIQKMNEELGLYIKQQGFRKRTLKEELEFERKVSADKIKILDAELANKKISQTKYEAEILDIKNNLLQKQAELTVDNARKELEAFNDKNRSKLDSEKFLSEELYNEEKSRFERLAEQRKEFAKLQLEQGVINQTEYNEAINQINEENRIKNEELRIEREEAKKEQQAIDLENKMIEAEEQYQNDFAIRQSQLENDRKAELAAAEKTGADKTLINKKYNAFEKTLGKDLTEFKNQQNASILGGLKGLFGESTALGKAFAIAEITTNTVQNAAKAFNQAAVFAANPLTLPLAANASIQGGIVIATGAAQAAKVAGVKFSKGDILKGKSHAEGGIPFSIGGMLGFEAEGGESIINKKSTSMFAPLLSAINVAGGGKKFASGDILGQNTSPSSISIIDYDLLASKVSEANASLPSPVVGVDEIASVSNNVAVIEEIASL